MKTILKEKFTLIFSIFFLFITFVNVYAQENGQWEILNEGIPNNYDKFDFVNAQVGWLTERNRFNSYRIYGLIKTEDGGENWKLIQLSGDIYFLMIDFTSDYIGWAFGNSEADDGGG